MRGEYSLADIKAVTDGNNNDGFGGSNGAWWIIIIIILFGWGRNGFGNGFGGGNNGSTSVYEGYVLGNDFSQLSRQLSDLISKWFKEKTGYDINPESNYYDGCSDSSLWWYLEEDYWEGSVPHDGKMRIYVFSQPEDTEEYWGSFGTTDFVFLVTDDFF